MEDNIPRIQYDNLQKQYINKLLKNLDERQTNAVDIRDEMTAKNPELRRALSIVEHFLRQTHLPCYGGMAINAHLPSDKKFYDFSKSLPDYDFYSPTPEEDTNKLIALLEKAKFSNIAMRFGVHEGTYKVYVNYHAIADITLMKPWLFKKLFKSTIIEDGIYYVSADYLRMGMYIELSRPLGEVERWDKVYKRLLLLNIFKPIKPTCDTPTTSISLDKKIYSELLKYIIDEKFIFAGAELADIYKNPNKTSITLSKTAYPLIVYCDNPVAYVSRIKQLIYKNDQSVELKIIHWEPILKLIPEMYGVKINGKISLILMEKIYCHSYNTISVPKYGKLLISSLDNAIALYFSISYLRNLDEIVPETLLCFAHRLVEISTNTRDKNKSGRYPAFAIECSGHQPSKESLLEAKAKRVKQWRLEKKRNNTRKNNKNQKNQKNQNLRRTIRR